MAIDAEEHQRFADRYAMTGTDAYLAAERQALGSDYQANGYTTVAEADDLGELLHLRSGDVLADIGSGCGWPGLYLASRVGCDLVSIDPVAEGAVASNVRATADGLTDRALAVRANASEIPLRSGSVDAVVHTDLLC